MCPVSILTEGGAEMLRPHKHFFFFFTVTGCHLMMGERGEQAGECKSEGPLGGYEVGSKVLWEALCHGWVCLIKREYTERLNPSVRDLPALFFFSAAGGRGNYGGGGACRGPELSC